MLLQNQMQIKWRNKKNEEGFSLVEVLVSMAIFTIAIISSLSVMSRASRVSINNDLRSQAGLIAIRTMEFLKRPDGQYINCANQAPIVVNTSRTDLVFYSVGNINITNSTTKLNSLCITEVTSSPGPISACGAANSFKVNVTKPAGTLYKGNPNFCLQIDFNAIPNTSYVQIKLRMAYPDANNKTIINEWYGIK